MFLAPPFFLLLAFFFTGIFCRPTAKQFRRVHSSTLQVSLFIWKKFSAFFPAGISRNTAEESVRPVRCHLFRQIARRHCSAFCQFLFSDKFILPYNFSQEKLEALDKLFMGLPHPLLQQLPVPSAFRRLPVDMQKDIHAIYYATTIGFGEKMRRLEKLIRKLPDQQRELLPIRPIEVEGGRGWAGPNSVEGGNADRRHNHQMPTLVEFEVPVLLQFNGHMVGVEVGIGLWGNAKGHAESRNSRRRTC